MHYKNGRPANVGDLVIGKGYNLPGVIVGRILTITSANKCNCTLAIVGDAARPVITEFSQLDYFYHVEDSLALSEAAYKKPEPKPKPIPPERDDTNFPGYAEKLCTPPPTYGWRLVDESKLILLNESQEAAVKNWAADDRLWKTQKVVEINLRTFARLLLARRVVEGRE